MLEDVPLVGLSPGFGDGGGLRGLVTRPPLLVSRLKNVTVRFSDSKRGTNMPLLLGVACNLRRTSFATALLALVVCANAPTHAGTILPVGSGGVVGYSLLDPHHGFRGRNITVGQLIYGANRMPIFAGRLV